MLRCVARRYQGGGLTLLESCRGCCWSRYDTKPEIGDEKSASLMTSLDASRMYDLNAIHKNLCIYLYFTNNLVKMFPWKDIGSAIRVQIQDKAVCISNLANIL